MPRPHTERHICRSPNQFSLTSLEVHEILRDEFGVPLPESAIIDFWPDSPHAAIIGYINGQQVIAHNSKDEMRCVLSWPEDVRKGMRFRMVAYPLSDAHAREIWQRALADIQSGVRWDGLDNCQDFVTRAYTGQNGSPGRDAILGVAAIFGVGALIIEALIDKPTRRRSSRRRY
jgi:hypothetical protein